MPHTVKKQGKRVIITNDTKFVLSAYEEAIHDLSEEQKNALGLSLEEKLREGFTPSVLKVAESVFKNKFGATECYLGALEYSLSDFAYQLKERFLLCINRLVEVAGKTALDAEKDKIDSRYILLRELLLRLVIVALSNEENRKRSGKKLINALHCFVKAITTEKGEALGLDFNFRLELNQQLARWVGDFKSAVTTIELMHLPENALTGLINYLDHVKQAVKAHILVQCYPVDSQANLSDDWIEKTYQAFLYGKNSGVIAQVNPSTLSLTMLTEAQANKLEWIKSNNKKKDQLFGLFSENKGHKSDLSVKKENHLSDLFLLLNHTELLHGMTTRLDDVIELSKWVLLLTEKLSFDGLIEHLAMHRRLCNERLDVEKVGLKKASKARRMLLDNDYNSGESITQVLPELCEKLRNLGSHRHHCLIIEQFAGNITELLVYQKRLNIQVVCEGPMNQGRLAINQHQPIKYSVAQTLLPELPSQNLATPVQTEDLSLVTTRATPVETTKHFSKPLPVPPPKINMKKREERSSLEVVLPSTSLPELVHEAILVTPEILLSTEAIEVETFYQPTETVVFKAGENHSSTVSSIQETIMAEGKYEQQYDNNPFESTTGMSEEETVLLLHDVKRQPGDFNDDHSVNHNPDATPSEVALVYTRYLRDFFDQYENANQQESILSLQKRFFYQQIKMGGKNRIESDRSYNMDAFTTADNFLNTFSQDGRLFSAAGSFCQAVRNAILGFEQKQMDARKPTGFLLFLTKKDVFWECRNLESICIKKLCVETAKKAADERDLEGVVKLCIRKGTWGFGSDYNELKFALQRIMEKVEKGQIRLRKYLVPAPQVQLEAENGRLKDENTGLTKQVIQQKSLINQLHRENQELRTTIQQQNAKLANHDQEFAKQRQEFTNQFANQRQEYTNLIQQLRNEMSNGSVMPTNRESNMSHRSGFHFHLPRPSSAMNNQKKMSNEAQSQETSKYNTLS
jgi:hypothetical protein